MISKKIDKTKITAFQQKILSWYKKNKRDLPWRKTTDPYKILVSEVMLQQTQVDRVIRYYERFLEHYPDIHSLANADKITLLKLWSGLGYNNRVLRLQKLSQKLVEEKKTSLPPEEEALISLPGIGPYTAHAVLAFAFNKAVPVMDTNIRRVLIHEFKLKEDISMEDLKQLAMSCIPAKKSCIWHNALMDYGATFLTARKTGIKPLSKQSKFEGSTRQIRGYIVKCLLKEKKVSISSLQKKFNQQQAENVLSKLVKEGLVKKSGGFIEFA